MDRYLPEILLRFSKYFFDHNYIAFDLSQHPSDSLPGGGGYSIKFYSGRLRLEVQTLTLKYNNCYQNGTPFIYLEQNCTPFLHLKDKPKQ